MTELEQQLKSEKPDGELISLNWYQEKIEALSVPPKFKDADVKSINPLLLESCSGFLQGESLYIYGGVGVGKTYLAYALVKKLIECWGGERFYPERNVVVCVPNVLFLPATEIFLKIRNAFRQNSTETEEVLLREYMDIGCLVIDDMGVEKVTEWTGQTLSAIIDHRYTHDRQILITSNYNLTELAEKLGDLIGDRIVSRLTEMCKIIHLKGKDRRLQ